MHALQTYRDKKAIADLISRYNRHSGTGDYDE